MKLNNDLTVIKDLGAGAYGQVYLCNYQHDNFSKIVAVKKISKQDNVDIVVKEAKINSNLIHPNIIQIYNVEKDFDSNMLLIFEYIEGVSLREYLDKNKSIQLEEALYIFKSLIAGLEYLHRNNVIHHDLSPRNIMLGHHGEVKILDFGLSKIQDQEKNELSEISGSISYYDPYLIQNKKSYDMDADLYSSMLILFELLTGAKFFPAASPLEMLDYLKNFQDVADEDLENIDDENIKSILKKSLSVKREVRLPLSVIKDSLKDYNTFAFVLKDNPSVKNSTSETVTNLRRTPSKFRSSKKNLLGISVVVLIILFAQLKNKNSPEFYVGQNDQMFSASIKMNNRDIENYSDAGQLFDSKSCDYFYYSFIVSVVMLDTDYLNQNKTIVNPFDVRVNHVGRFFKIKNRMDGKCLLKKHIAISNTLNSFTSIFNDIKNNKNINIENVTKSQGFRDIVKIFEIDNTMATSFEEATDFYKNNFYNVNSLTGFDVYKVSPEVLNLDSCSTLSQFAYIGKLINLNENLIDSEDIKIIGFSNDVNLEIHGKYKEKIFFDNRNGSNYKDKEYCLYSISNNKASSYFGKLEFTKN